MMDPKVALENTAYYKHKHPLRESLLLRDLLNRMFSAWEKFMPWIKRCLEFSSGIYQYMYSGGPVLDVSS